MIDKEFLLNAAEEITKKMTNLFFSEIKIIPDETTTSEFMSIIVSVIASVSASILENVYTAIPPAGEREI